MVMVGPFRKMQKSYVLSSNLDLFLDCEKSIMLIVSIFGVIFFRLPSYYFLKKSENLIELLFVNKFFFSSFITHFFLFYERASMLYFLKLKVKGLGYRIRKISASLYYFFFNYTNMFYFHVPKNILIKCYKKSMILVGNDFSQLKMVFSHILLLKTIGPYRLRGMRYPRQIVMLKIKTKKV